MKNKLVLLAIICAALLSCDTDYDNDPNTICNAKFYSFQTQNEATAVGDIFNVGYLSKFNAATPSVFSNSIPNNSFTDVGTLFYPSSSLKFDNSELVCLANKTGGKRLFKADLISNTLIQNNAISSSLSAPVFVFNNLRFLKITNKVTQTSAPYNDVISFDAELVDESETSVSGAPQNIILPSAVENGFRDANIEGVFLNNKVYFLANCQILVYDIITNLFSVHTISTYNQANDRKFMQGMEISNTNTLVMLQQTVSPNYKIEIIELPSVATSVFTPIVKYNLLQADFPANAPQLASIINTMDRRSTTYDKCDNKYYLTYMSNYNPYNTEVYEIDLNAYSIASYPFNNNFLFGLEVQK
ncbi:hypothetical protein ACFSX9_05340 [Flavobacterium ardleyense]|uniref:Lipoprotein n=1 Tax=Flavobacterium ardleyense TaxID=2038737 RepID=A0ABW5Z6K0_9FLAO